MNNYITCSKCGITYNPNEHEHTEEICLMFQLKAKEPKRKSLILSRQEAIDRANECRKLRKKGFKIKDLVIKYGYKSTGAISSLLRRH